MKNVYINIGNEKSCFFVSSSIFLIKTLKNYPLLYDSVEEALKCAQIGFYSVGIIVLSQLLNLLKEKTPSKRHEIAHEILKLRPNKKDYEKIIEDFKKAASKKQIEEMLKYKSNIEYTKALEQAWAELRESYESDKILTGAWGSIGLP